MAPWSYFYDPSDRDLKLLIRGFSAFLFIFLVSDDYYLVVLIIFS